MLPGYMYGVNEAAAIPVMLSLVNDDVSLKETAHYFDGFIFAGGEDLNPAIYHQEKAEYCGKLNQKRDEMEPKLLNNLIEANKPHLGKYRVIQL